MPTLVVVNTLDYVVHVGVEKKLPATTVTVGANTTGPRLREIGELARSGTEAAGFDWPRKRVSIHAEPRERPTTHATYAQIPLAAALGVLVLNGDLDESVLHRVFAHADLSLNGELRPLSRSLRAAESAGPNTMILGPGEYTERVLDYLSSNRTIYAAATLKDLVADLKAEELCRGRREGELSWPLAPARDARWFLPLGTTIVVHGGDSRDEARKAFSTLSASVPRLLNIIRGLDTYSAGAVDPTEPLELIRAMDDIAMLPPEPQLLRRPLRMPHHTIGVDALRREAQIAVGGVLYLENAHLFAPVVRSAFKTLPGAAGRVLVAQVDTREQADAIRAYLPAASIILPMGVL